MAQNYTMVANWTPSIILVGVPSCASVGLGWNGISNGTVYWQVFRKSGNGAYTMIADRVYFSTYGDTNITKNQTYTYKVVRVDGVIQTQSNEVTVTPGTTDLCEDICV